MRIAVITNAYPPHARGGAGVVAADLVALWRAAGHEVCVWTERVDWLQRNVLARLIGHLWCDTGEARCLSEVVAWRPDIVVTHNLTGVGWATGSALQVHGLTWIHVLHDVQLFEPSGQLYEDRVTYWQRGWAYWRRRVFGMPNLVVSPTEWLLRAHERRGFSFLHTRVVVNPAPHSLNKVSIDRNQSPWIYVGRLSTEKGADMLHALAKALPKESFLCVGDGPWRSVLEQRENIRCVGTYTRADVQAALHSSKGLLAPSRLQENQPTIILEAFAEEIPVIASDRGGIPETVADAGIVIPLELSRWIDAMREMSATLSHWSSRAQKRAEGFNREKVGSLWSELFDHLTIPSKN